MTTKITKRKLLRVFNTERAIARVLGVTQQAVNKWQMDKPIPALRSLQIKTLFPDRFGSPEPVETKGFTTNYTPPGRPEARP